MKILEVDKISREENNRFALKPTSFSVQSHEKLAIMGETGSGKSTLLKMMAGLLQPSSGTIKFENQKLEGPDEKLIPGHPSIAYLSQHFELRNNYFVHEILEMASKIEIHERKIIYNDCKIHHVLNRKTNELSGGERQRVALAKALVSKPRLLLLDEPFTNLDMQNKTMMNEVIHSITSSNNITCILVSHDPIDVLSWADRIFIMKEGEIIQMGIPKEIYLNPANDYAASVLGPYNYIPAHEKELKKQLHVPADRTYIRPEEFHFLKSSSLKSNAKIQSKKYCGPYTSYTLETSSTLLHVHSIEHNFNTGDEVMIRFQIGS